MRYYLDPNTSEPVRFDLKANQWAELRCDRSTRYDPRWVPTTVTPEQAKTLRQITPSEMDEYRTEMGRENSAARGELFIKEMDASRATRPRNGGIF